MLNELVSNINDKCESFIKDLTSNELDEEKFSVLLGCINSIQDTSLVVDFKAEIISQMLVVYQKISEIIKKVPTLGVLLIGLGDDYYHQRTDKDTGKKYSCPHHLEKLQSHVLIASVIACNRSIQKSMDDHTIIKNTLTALFHDVGKKECCIYYKDGAIGYPFHGEMGCGVMLNVWCKELEEFFTKDEWEDMCRAICVHMCGYHETDETRRHTKYKWKLLSLENKNVKNSLLTLSVSDHFAGIKSPKVKEDPNIYINSRIIFEEYLLKKSVNWDEFMKVNGFEGVLVIYRYTEELKNTNMKIYERFNTEMSLDKPLDDDDKLKEKGIIAFATKRAYSENLDNELPEWFIKRLRIVVDVITKDSFCNNFGWISKDHSDRFKKLSSISTGYTVMKDLSKEKFRPHIVHVLMVEDNEFKLFDKRISDQLCYFSNIISEFN